MKNKYFPDEDITMNDLYFICYMIERVARHIKQKNKYVVNAIGKDELYHLLSCASTLHCENLEMCIRDRVARPSQKNVVSNLPLRVVRSLFIY